MRSRLTSSLLGLALLLALPAQGAEVGPVLEQVAAAYADAKTVQVALKQTTTGPSYFDALVQTGSFVVQKPDRIRWELNGSGGTNTWISDGETLWIVQPTEKTVQVFKHVAAGIQRYIGFLSGLSDVQKDFDVTLVADGPEAIEGRTVLRLSPKGRDEQLKAIFVQVDADFHVVGVVMLSPFGDRTDMQLSGLALNVEAPAGTFKPPATDGWHVVPMD
jgi:outer membrane lipoprotein-sorting protein